MNFFISKLFSFCYPAECGTLAIGTALNKGPAETLQQVPLQVQTHYSSSSLLPQTFSSAIHHPRKVGL